MSITWTPNQSDAINIRDTSVIVSAAAGSGKTAVLVERLLQILSDEENPVPADKIVVVTFTSDAAAQMKQRLSDAVARKSAENPENLWLLKQHALIPSAKISTISSFCFDLVREHNKNLGISSNFKIVPPNEIKILHKKAIDNTLEKYYSESPEKMVSLIKATTISKQNDENLVEMIGKIMEFLDKIPFPKLWLESATQKYLKDFDAENDDFIKIYKEKIRDNLAKMQALSDKALNLFDDILEYGDLNDKQKITAEKNHNIIESENYTINEYLNNLNCEQLDFNKKFNFNFTFTGFARFILDKTSDEYAKYQIVKSYRDGYKKNVPKNTYTLEEIKDDYSKNAEIISTIIEIVSSALDELSAIKLEKNALEFSDAEHFAVKLLTEFENGKIVKSKLAKELSDFYDLIMIDEYQDSNNTQNLIFRMLSKNGTEDKNGTNIFAVGDVKQAIYGFRYANPQNFTDTLSVSETYDNTKDMTDNTAIYLNQNFRSSTDVIQFVNFVFDNLMKEKSGGVDYQNGHQLRLGASYSDEDRTTEIMLIEPSPGDETFDDDSDNDDDSGELPIGNNSSAKAVAKKILELLATKKVSEKGVLRDAKYSDFCILVREKKYAKVYFDELQNLGIKAYHEEFAGYLNSKEILIITNFLTIISNPMLDVPMVSVLHSPLFMVSADELAYLRTFKSKSNHISHFFQFINTALETDKNISPELSTKLKFFLDTYKKLRVFSSTHTLSALISEIYDSTDFLSSVEVYRDGKQQKANLRLLLSYAKSYEENSFGGLSGFIFYIQDMKKTGNDFKKALITSSSEDAVAIKTIHASKGLEFPFVFLCETQIKFKTKDDSANLQINPNLGLGIEIISRKNLTKYKSFPQDMISYENSKTRKSEELRLLYVALTRAKEQLYIPISYGDETQSKVGKIASSISASDYNLPDIFDTAICMLDWILMILLSHKSGKIFGMDVIEKTIETDAKIKIYNVNPAENSDLDSTESEEKTAETEVVDEEIVENLLKRYNFKYDMENANSLAKLSITEIAKNNSNDYNLTLKRPEFLRKKSLTGAEIGSATHRFLENLSFSEDESNDAKTLADDMFERGIFTKAERENLPIEKINNFFQTEIYQRMKSAQKLYKEKRFFIEFSELTLDKNENFCYNDKSMLNGVVDCFFFENDRIVALDYKTDRVSCEDELIEKYSSQLYLYVKALEKIYNTKDSLGYIYSFSLGREIKIF